MSLRFCFSRPLSLSVSVCDCLSVRPSVGRSVCLFVSLSLSLSLSESLSLSLVVYLSSSRLSNVAAGQRYELCMQLFILLDVAFR